MQFGDYLNVTLQFIIMVINFNSLNIVKCDNSFYFNKKFKYLKR